MMQKQLQFIRQEMGVDASPLSMDDIKKLCQYALNCKALKTPRLAEIEAKDCGLTITLRK